MTTKEHASLEGVRHILRTRGYVDSNGFFQAESQDSAPESAAEKTWSAAATVNPIHAAAASQSSDPFTKYPLFVEEGLADVSGLVLDAGCGYGRVAIPLLRKHRRLELVGADASPVMLTEFRRLVSEHAPELKNRFVLLHSTINALPLSDGTLNAVYSCAVLLHNPYAEVVRILREFHRLLRPGGKLVLQGSFPNVYNLEGIQSFFYLKFRDEPHVNGPVRVYTKRHVRALFADWTTAAVKPVGRVVLPRSIASVPLPFGQTIREVNARATRAAQPKTGSSMLAQCFDVVAVK